MTTPEPDGDAVGLALRGLAAGILAGVTGNAIVGLVVRTLQAQARPATSLDLERPEALVLFLGTLLACAAGAAATAIILRRLANPYRQGMFALTAFFGSLVSSMVLTMVAERVAGRVGLIVLAVLSMTGTVWLASRIRSPAMGGGPAMRPTRDPS